MNDLDRERLARRVSSVMGVPVAQARIAVFQLEAERKRQVIDGELETYQRPVCDADRGQATEAHAMEDAKICTRCGKPQPVGCFSARRRSPDGRSPWCTTCMREYREERKGPGYQPRATRPRITYDQQRRVLAMVAEGHKYSHIASVTGVAPATISRVRHEAVDPQ